MGEAVIMADTGQNFEGLLETIKRNRAQLSIEEDALASNECPIHMVALKVNARGELSCPFGHIYSSENDY